MEELVGDVLERSVVGRAGMGEGRVEDEEGGRVVEMRKCIFDVDGLVFVVFVVAEVADVCLADVVVGDGGVWSLSSFGHVLDLDEVERGGICHQ